MVTVNRLAVFAPFREPRPTSDQQPSKIRPFRTSMCMANSAYRTPYPLVPPATGERLG